MPHPQLYTDLAWLWPILSPPEDCADEAALIRDLLHAELDIPAQAASRQAVLELGSGCGHILCFLTEEIDAVAVDLSPAMLDHSRRLNPGVEHVAGDLRTVRLGRTFDAVLATDVLDYMTDEADLAAAFATAAAHMRSGGVFIAAANYLRETFIDRDMAEDARRTDNLEVRLVSHVYDPDPADTTFRFTMTLALRQDGLLRVVEDQHTCGLFPLATWQRLLDEAGFNVRVVQLQEDGDVVTSPIEAVTAEDLEGGWPWFVARKR